MANPGCPYCGERQAYDEARPSKPHVTRDHKTEWFTECRACGKRIIWTIPFIPPGPPRWSKNTTDRDVV